MITMRLNDFNEFIWPPGGHDHRSASQTWRAGQRAAMYGHIKIQLIALSPRAKVATNPSRTIVDIAPNSAPTVAHLKIFRLQICELFDFIMSIYIRIRQSSTVRFP